MGADQGRFDLTIRGGTVVTADARFEADLGIRGGRVVQIGGQVRGEREIDASVLPGGPGGQVRRPRGHIDAHVHLTFGPAW